MTTKQRSKPLEILTTQSKNKDKQKLSLIGKKLLSYCKIPQPVLLYGEYKDREDLFRDVHLAIDDNNIDAGREYIDDDGKPATREKLQGKFKEIYESKGLKELDFIKQEVFLLDHSKSTAKTCGCVDCGGMSAKEVYIELVIDAGIIDKAEAGDEESKKLLDKYMSMDIGRISKDELRSLQGNDSLIDITSFSDAKELQDMLNGKIPEVEPVYKGYLFQCKGNLFIDNLPKPTSSEDEKYYRLLAKIIKDRECGYPFTTFNWLVVYTPDHTTFPEYFKEQFELVSLDGKVKEKKIEDKQRGVENTNTTATKANDESVTVKVDSKRNILTYMNKAKKMKPMQIRLLRLLYGNRDTFVTRDTILEDLWGRKYVYDKQITDHATGIRKVFKQLGFKGTIIETIKKSNATDGGYIFHSDIILLDFI